MVVKYLLILFAYNGPAERGLHAYDAKLYERLKTTALIVNFKFQAVRIDALVKELEARREERYQRYIPSLSPSNRLTTDIQNRLSVDIPHQERVVAALERDPVKNAAELESQRKALEFYREQQRALVELAKGR